MSTDGFAITISPNIGSMGGLSQSLLNTLTLVAEDRPTISITNASASSDITGFSIQMGNSSFRVRLIDYRSAAGVDRGRHQPSAHERAGHARQQPLGFVDVQWIFARQIYDFRVDLDRVSDHGASLVDYKQALASGSDPSQWATVTVSFSDGQTMTEKITPSDISGAAQNPIYSYFYCLRSIPSAGEINVQNSIPTPEPSTWLLATFGAAGLALAAIRRRR